MVRCRLASLVSMAFWRCNSQSMAAYSSFSVASSTWSSSASVVSRQFRAVASWSRAEEPLGDHGQDEVPLPRGPGGDEVIEAEATDHRQDRFDVSMGQ